MMDFFGTRSEPVEYDQTHPERFYELAPTDKALPEEWKQQGWRDVLRWEEPIVELCSACGWTSWEQIHSSYLPRIKIMHARDNAGLWSLGSKWLVKDQPNDSTSGNEYMTWKFLHEQPGHSIPLVKEMRRLTDPEDQIQFTLVSRAPGKPLESVWGTLSPEQKSGYRDQMVDILKQLRQFTAPFLQKVNGDKLGDNVFICARRHPPHCFQVGSTEEEWLENLSETLRTGLSNQHRITDEELVEKKLQEIKDLFPRGGPYTLTHGDLNLTNIIVKDDKIQAIIDWELAGYLPWWAEKYISGAFGSENTDDLFEGVWERVHPDLADGVFRPAIIEKLKPIRQAVRCAMARHEDQRHGFYRPPFSKCHPFGGFILPKTLGIPHSHELGDWRNNRGNDNIEWSINVKDPMVRKIMDQNTPAPTPSAASARWFKQVELSGQEK